MTTLIEQIEEMRLRMNRLAAEEHGLVRSLGDVLASADQRLLEEVRSVTAAHEVRRGQILRELQALAGRMCALQKPSDETAMMPPREAEEMSRDHDRCRTEATLEDEITSHLQIGRGSRA